MYVLGPAVVGRKTPLRLDPTFGLEPMERLIERRVLEGEHAVGALVHPAGNGVAVRWAHLQRSEDEQVDRPLEQGQSVRVTAPSTVGYSGMFP